MGKRILIAAGGAGGHVYPAQGLAHQLTEKGVEILFVAGGLASNRYFDRSSYPYQEVTCRPVVSKNPLKSLLGLAATGQGIWQSIRILRSFKPDVVVGFGSYYSIPTIVAAKLLGIPIVLHEANCVPGMANSWLAPFVDVVGVHFPATVALMKGKNVVEVGLPLRRGYQRALTTKEKASSHFKLDADKQILLVFGGSQGARAINQLIKGCVEGPLDGVQKNVQLIHLTGEPHSTDQWNVLYQSKGWKACVKPFEQEMNLAWEAADAFIGRSGAATVAEAMEFEVPGILIPYPYANQHQEQNADFFTETVGGGIKRLEGTLNAQILADEVRALLPKTRLEQLSSAIRAYKQRPMRTDLCQVVMDTASKTGMAK